MGPRVSNSETQRTKYSDFKNLFGELKIKMKNADRHGYPVSYSLIDSSSLKATSTTERRSDCTT